MRPKLRFYDKWSQRVRAVPYRWVSEDINVALVDEELRIINSFAYGTTTIWAERPSRARNRRR